MERLTFISTSVVILAAVFFLMAERRWPYNANQKSFRDGFWVDLFGYGVFQSYFMGVVIAWLLKGLGPTSSGVSHWPIFTQCVFFILTHDFVTYCIHRLQHRFTFFWYTHEAHHSGRAVDWLSGIRSHSLEILLYETAKFLPIIALGASPEVPLYRAMFDSTYGMFIHSNLNIRLGVLRLFFNGPEYHRWHHATGKKNVYGMNLGTKFTIWDRLFRTLYEPRGQKADQYGIEEANYPSGYLEQHFFFLKRLALSFKS